MDHHGGQAPPGAATRPRRLRRGCDILGPAHPDEAEVVRTTTPDPASPMPAFSARTTARLAGNGGTPTPSGRLFLHPSVRSKRAWRGNSGASPSPASTVPTDASGEPRGPALEAGTRRHVPRGAFARPPHGRCFRLRLTGTGRLQSGIPRLRACRRPRMASVILWRRRGPPGARWGGVSGAETLPWL